jgi:hypothetical protein
VCILCTLGEFNCLLGVCMRGDLGARGVTKSNRQGRAVY